MPHIICGPGVMTAIVARERVRILMRMKVCDFGSSIVELTYAMIERAIRARVAPSCGSLRMPSRRSSSAIAWSYAIFSKWGTRHFRRRNSDEIRRRVYQHAAGGDRLLNLATAAAVDSEWPRNPCAEQPNRGEIIKVRTLRLLMERDLGPSTISFGARRANRAWRRCHPTPRPLSPRFVRIIIEFRVGVGVLHATQHPQHPVDAFLRAGRQVFRNQQRRAVGRSETGQRPSAGAEILRGGSDSSRFDVGALVGVDLHRHEVIVDGRSRPFASA